MPTNLFFSHATDLPQALGLKPSDVVSLVGGGGKTSIMFRLARELAAAGNHVISTTTTRIIPPTPEESECIIAEEDATDLAVRAKAALQHYHHITIARSNPDTYKLVGLLPETVDYLHHLGLADYVINEADGAACQPLKAPNSTEPVIPLSTSLVVAVVGIEAIGQPLLPNTAFRIEYISRLTKLNQGELITTEAVSLLLTHPQGIIQYAPKGRIVPFINKVGESQVTQAKTLAGDILGRRHPQIEMVVFGEVRRPDFPLTVVSLKQSDRLQD